MRVAAIGVCVLLLAGAGMSCVRRRGSAEGNGEKPREVVGVLYYFGFGSYTARPVYEANIVAGGWDYRATITSCGDSCRRFARLVKNGRQQRCGHAPDFARLVMRSKVLGDVVVDKFGCTNDGRAIDIKELTAALEALMASKEVFLEIDHRYLWPPEELRKPRSERRNGPFDWVPPLKDREIATDAGAEDRRIP